MESTQTSASEQPTGQAEQPQVAVTEQAGSEVVEQTTQSQEESFFDPKGLSPELQQAYKQMQAAFTKKTQDISEARKKAETLDQLVGYSPFVKWYNGHVNGEPTTGKPTEQLGEPEKAPQAILDSLSEEEMQLLSTDPKKFKEVLRQAIREEASQALLPMMLETRKEVEYQKNLSKVESFSKEHSDFWDLDDKGLIDPLIAKYPGMGLEDIYKLAKYPYLEQDAVQKAHGIVQQKKAATVEKPGVGLPSSNKVRVKSREEAMALAWDYAERGQTVPEFEFDK